MKIQTYQNQPNFKGRLAGYDRKGLERLGVLTGVWEFADTILPKIGDDNTLVYVDAIGKDVGVCCKQVFAPTNFKDKLVWGSTNAKQYGSILHWYFRDIVELLGKVTENLYKKCMQDTKAAEFKIRENVRSDMELETMSEKLSKHAEKKPSRKY